MGKIMPLDNIRESPIEHDWGLNKVNNWKLKFCWVPKKCFLSKQKIWAKLAYRGVALIPGPGETIEEIYWIEKYKFLLWNLKGKK